MLDEDFTKMRSGRLLRAAAGGQVNGIGTSIFGQFVCNSASTLDGLLGFVSHFFVVRTNRIKYINILKK